MKVGLLQEAELMEGVDPNQRYWEMIEEVALADRLGFSCWGTSEQHFSPPRFTVSAPEVLYALEVEEPSRLWVHLREPELHAVLHLRRDCQDASSELVCQKQVAVERRPARTGRPPRGLNRLLEPGRYTLFVDGGSHINGSPWAPELPEDLPS